MKVWVGGVVVVVVDRRDVRDQNRPQIDRRLMVGAMGRCGGGGSSFGCKC